MTKTDKVDIIIVTYKAKKLLKNCISSIRKHTQNLNYLITVVDNGSRCGTVKFLRKQKDINLIRNNKNLGFSKAVNIGIKQTHNDLIVCLDDDVEVTEGWLEGLLRHIKDKNVGIVGCKIVFPNGRIHSAEYRVKPLGLAGGGEIDRGQTDYIRNVDALIGPCWLMKRDVVKKIGYFDERFFPCQHEDIDFCLRARLAGYKIIYNGKLKVIHHNLFRDSGLFDKNWQRFLRKWRNLKYPFQDSHPADKYNATAYSYCKNRKFKEAFEEFKKAKRIDKRFFLPLWSAFAEMRLGKYKNAIKEFERLKRFDPLGHMYTIFVRTGISNFLLGCYKEAANNFEKALKIRPHDLDVRCQLAKSYAEVGEPNKAMSEYNKVILTSKKGSKNKSNRLQVLRLSEVKKQIGACKALKRNPHDIEAHFVLAMFYEKLGWFKNAKMEYNLITALLNKRINSVKKKLKAEPKPRLSSLHRKSESKKNAVLAFFKK